MNVYFPSDDPRCGELRLMLSGDTYLSLSELAERTARGERFEVCDPFTREPHALLSCTCAPLDRLAEARSLVLFVKNKETCSGGVCGSGRAWSHRLPLLGAENALCIAERHGLYRWRRAAQRINNVAVLNRWGVVDFAHAEEKALCRLSARSGYTVYTLRLADDAPCAFFDGRIRFIMAEQVPTEAVNHRPFPLAAAIRELKSGYTRGRVRVLRLQGRITAPDMLLETADASHRTQLVHRRGEQAGEYVWELLFTRPATGQKLYERRLSSLTAAPAYRTLAHWWARTARLYASRYVNKCIIATAPTEDAMVGDCIDFLSRFFRPAADDCPLLRELTQSSPWDDELPEESEE